MPSLTSWSRTEPIRSAFALPSGLRGRLAGHLMLWTNPQRDLPDLMDIQVGDQVLEVGYGPGALIRLLARTPAGQISGVDPSPQMWDMASRQTRAEVAAGRIDLRIGTAEHSGFADEQFDRVVSVNNVAIWSDLEAGLVELHRVACPGGQILIAWHGGTRPSRIAQHMLLTDDQLDRIQHALAGLCSDVTRRGLATLTVFDATR